MAQCFRSPVQDRLVSYASPLVCPCRFVQYLQFCLDFPWDQSIFLRPNAQRKKQEMPINILISIHLLVTRTALHATSWLCCKGYRKIRLHGRRSIVHRIIESLYSLAAISYSHSGVNISTGSFFFLHIDTHAGPSRPHPYLQDVQCARQASRRQGPDRGRSLQLARPWTPGSTLEYPCSCCLCCIS